MPETDLPADGAPVTIRRAGLLVALEGLVAVGTAVFLVIHGLLGADQSVTSGYGTAAWFAILGGGVVVGGVALMRGRRWGRAIALVAQIVLAPTAVIIASDQPQYGIPLLVVVAAIVVLLFWPSSVRWLAQGYAPDATPPR